MTITVRRCPENPLITPEDLAPSRPDLTVIGVFNAAIAVHEGQVVALLRVAEAPVASTPERPVVVDAVGGHLNLTELDRPALEAQGWDFSDSRTVQAPASGPGAAGLTVRHLTSISHLRLARSVDGATFIVNDEPFISPEVPAEEWGVEDPRMVCVDGQYVITYSAVSRNGIATMMATTRDFTSVTRVGLMLAPENRNVALFPERINGMHHAFHRPVPQMFGRPAIWIADSPDLVHWGNHELVTSVSESGWESGRIGAAAPPIATEAGWLFIYHAADQDNRYCLGAMLLPLDSPRVVSHRLPMPLMQPEAEYETNGFFSEVVFSCGAALFGQDLWVYYGAADRSFAGARFDLAEVLKELMAHPLDRADQPLDCRELVAGYRKAGAGVREAAELHFVGVEGDLDVYNVTAPFTHPDVPGTALLAGRVERRDSEHSQVRVFASTGNDEWTLLPAPVLELQDPFVSELGGVLHLGGVQVLEVPGSSPWERFIWRTVLYRCEQLSDPQEVFTGPWGMKDIRFLELSDGRIGIFTRPQGGDDAQGRIGFTVVNHIEEATEEVLARAPRLENQFAPGEWGGANHLVALPGGRIGVLGHIAAFDELRDRHYYPMSFEFDPHEFTWTAPRLLFERGDLKPGPAKRPDLADVVFPGGFALDGEHLVAHVGVSDATAQRVVISNPFSPVGA